MFGFSRRSRREVELARVDRAVRDLELPDAIYKSCPWQPRELVETGLRQWLRCCGAAMRDGQVIGMPSRAVDEAWHGLILCTELYARFCEQAYGRFLHHYPEGVAARAGSHGSMSAQLGRTVVAWAMVGAPGEPCVLWDLDTRVGVDAPWGIDAARVAAIEAELRRAELR
ncbi:hypothetical protein [Nocardia cyriacigeorgica]|uniref:hypothetical protein n=1 Tax=Nocardia cyriacigeorgica TaxID=135487 RepID=UPI0018935EB2|nr:hypothetical protein [Nocardia cyriacigeorgica]MBF6439434.1 hypothetical protein [Nocardia cyriacigeorgica]MBF6455694.1 hypothetical protein [Nocardia cyriacigeorgica]MBF6480239.1 hypothetical protein [Nocardia cyriacigeorgica]MBF6553564.1 hypothetical protein [Nocardia cyriacigeorgica]